MRTLLPAVLIMVLGFAVFSPILQTTFITDDISQIINNNRIKNIGNIPSLYVQSNTFPQKTLGIASHYYKPVFYTFYTILYLLGNGSPVVFHVFQVFVYNLNAFLVFMLFVKFFTKKTAFLLSIIFLVHPANEEVAASIAALQDALYLCFGLITLNLIISKIFNKWLILFISCLFALLSCLSKETGVLFLFIILFYVFIFQKNLFKAYALAFSIVGLIYLSLRIVAMHNPALVMTNTNQSTSLGERLFLIPKISFYYLEQLFVPSPYSPDSTYLKSSNLTQILFPSFVILCVLAILIAAGFCIRRYFKPLFPKFLFLCAWTVVGIGFHAQIIALDVLIASRWIYFPMVGILGMLGVVITILKPYVPKYKLVFLILYFLYLSAFTFATVKLNILRQNSKIEGFVGSDFSNSSLSSEANPRWPLNTISSLDYLKTDVLNPTGLNLRVED